MFTLMKTLHLFGLMMGAAGGVGHMLMSIHAKRAGGPPPPILMMLGKSFGLVTFAGVLLLWATGLWMWLVDYGGAMVNTAFALKLVAATLILIIVIVARIAMVRTAPGNPPPAFLRRLGPAGGALSYIAVALAVIAFG